MATPSQLHPASTRALVRSDHIGSKYNEYARTAMLKHAERDTVFRMVGALGSKCVPDLAGGFGVYTRLTINPACTLKKPYGAKDGCSFLRQTFEMMDRLC